jgi:hypothetical protein
MKNPGAIRRLIAEIYRYLARVKGPGITDVGLIGGVGFIPVDDFELGLFLIAPKTVYRDHRHPAPELYVPLTGPHEWRFETGASWTEYKAHTPIWNEPMQVHATLVRDLPFLSLFAWMRDVDTHATVTPSPDWNLIEAGL